MKILTRNIALLLISLSSLTAYGQHLGKIDSLKKVLKEQKNDTNKVKSLYNLSFSYVAGSYPDTALVYSQQALDLAEKLNYEPGIFWSEITLCESLAILGNHPLSLEHSFKALALAKKLDDTLKLCYANGNLASCYYFMGDYNTSVKYALDVLKIMDSDDNHWMWIQMSKAFHSMGQPDSAILYAKKAYDRIKGMDFVYARSVISPVLGNAYSGKANYDSALLYYRMGIPLSVKSHTETHLVDNYYGIAAVHKSKGNLDSSLWYCKKIVTEKITRTYPVGMLKTTNMLAEIYELNNNPDSALKYLKSAIAIKDSLFNQQKTIAVQNLIYKEQEKQKELQSVKLKFRNQVKLYILIGGLMVLAIITGVLVRNHRQKQLQSMRNSIADDLHDDIGSTLSSISIMSELAKAKSPQASTLLTSIGESTISVQENMSDIVWAIKSGNDSFENVFQRMNQFTSEILDAKNIEVNFESDASLSALRLSMKQRKNLYLFFKEVINNAAKHSGTKRVSVCMFKKEHYAEMIIKDDGKGFDTTQTFNGNGMSTLKKRAEELNGYFRIQSHPNEGTVVELKFKIT
ncbi:MAG TPA: ATP-binding protein [Chitinophagaceae bacterium]|nr:ATP-binding protein [Chitinophagaceae bacterium]